MTNNTPKVGIEVGASLDRSVGRTFNQASREVGGLGRDEKALDRSVGQANQALKQQDTALSSAAGEAARYGREVDDATGSNSVFSRSMTKVGEGLDGVLNKWTGLATGVAGVGSAYSTMTFDERITRLGIQANKSKEDMAKLKATIGDLPVHLLINNAGVLGGDHQVMDDMNYQDWAQTLAINTIAPFRVCEALMPQIKSASVGKSGKEVAKVLTISSMMGSLNRKSSGMYGYRSSKAAVNKVMQVMAHELKTDQVVVCPVHPGWVRTDMGGPDADISVAESAAGIAQLIDGLTLEHSGRFWQWNGEEHDW